MSDDLPPVHIDIERMNRMLAGPRIPIPSGLSLDELLAYLDEKSKELKNA